VSAFRLACTVAWTQLVQAMEQDGMTVEGKPGVATRNWIEESVRGVMETPAPVAEVYMDRWYETAPGCTGEREAVNVRFLRDAVLPPVGTKLYPAKEKTP
jgi:hypothetical protein